MDSVTESSESIRNIVQQINISDKIQIAMVLVTLLAVFVALFGERLWRYLDRPKLKLLFTLEPPLCHKTGMGQNKTPVYYFRFIVKNIGKIQAENCEVFIESVKKKNSNGEYEFFKNFTPVNLKWTGIREPFMRTIYPEKEMICDLGKIIQPPHLYKSQYVNATEEEQKMKKFILELPEVYYSQWDCLLPGSYKLNISVYSKNAKKVSKEFDLNWSGSWKDEEKSMFKELIIT